MRLRLSAVFLPLGLAGLAGLAVLWSTSTVVGANSSSTVVDAAKMGDADQVRALIAAGADINSAQGDGMTALHWAAERGDVALTEMLVTAGANPNAATRIGHYAPLHVASRTGQLGVAKVLLSSGADAMARTSRSGVTPLHLAASSGNPDLVTLLLDFDAEVNAREAEWDQTPLIFAAAKNRVRAINVLLEHGADPELTAKTVDLKSEGKLLEAAKNRERRVMAAFRGPGAPRPSERNVRTGQRATPPSLPDPEDLDAQSDVDPADSKSTEAKPLTASQIQAAIVAGRNLYESGKLPVKDESDGRRRFSPRLNIEKKGGFTALIHAARQGHIEAAEALLDGGADINRVSSGDGTSPLLIATINAQYDMATKLIERGADPNLAAPIHGSTPLWAAVNAQWQPRTRFPQPQQHGLQSATYLDLMETLLEAGADPNQRLSKHPWYMVYTGCGNRNCGLEDTNGATAFWRAAYATDVEAMRLLVKYGADPNIPTKTPPPRRPRAGTLAKQGDGSPLPVQPVAPGLWPATIAEMVKPDPSGLPKAKEGGPGVFPIHASSGVGYGEGFAGNAHRTAPGAWLMAVTYLVEELGVDVNARDYNGYNALHHAAARGDNEMIMYLVEKGCDVTAVSRSGQTTADMANGPVQRVSPFPETVALLESLGSKNNHNCVTC